jgi:hypothetical protein
MVRAKIKTVSFGLNATDTIPRLSISTVRDKTYARKEDEPLWAVEDSGLELDGISPLWGLISPSYKGFPNISVLQQPALNLVGYSGRVSDYFSIGRSLENSPGAMFPIMAMNRRHHIREVRQLGGVSTLAEAAFLTLRGKCQTGAADTPATLLWT